MSNNHKLFRVSNNNDDDDDGVKFVLPIGIGMFLILLFMNHFLDVPMKHPRFEMPTPSYRFLVNSELKKALNRNHIDYVFTRTTFNFPHMKEKCTQHFTVRKRGHMMSKYVVRDQCKKIDRYTIINQDRRWYFHIEGNHYSKDKHVIDDYMRAELEYVYSVQNEMYAAWKKSDAKWRKMEKERKEMEAVWEEDRL